MAAHFYVRDNEGDWVEVTGRVNLREPPTLVERAEEGAVGYATLIIDDPLLDLEIDPYTPILATEDESESDDQVWFAGTITNRRVVRMTGGYRNALGRYWVCDVVDLNERWRRRLLKASDANRSEETDNERTAWVLAQMVDWGLLDDDTTYVSSANASGDLDEEDFRLRYPEEAMGDAAEAKSKNWWIQKQGQLGSLTDYAWWGSDGNSAYSSDLYLTNDLAEIGPRVAAIRDRTSDVWPLRMDHGLRCIAERMFSGVGARHRSGTVYRRDSGTAAIIGVRDGLMTGTENKTKARTITRAVRYLEDMGAEEYRVEGRVRLPKEKQTMLRVGMRVPVAMTHWPFGLDEWTWWRVVSLGKTIATAGPWYDLDIELASTGDAAEGPPEPPYEGDAIAVLLGNGGTNAAPSREATNTGDSPPSGWSALASSGGLLPTSGTEASVRNVGGSPMVVRVSGDAWANTVIAGPATATLTMRLLKNGSPIASEVISQFEAGAAGWVEQCVFDWPGIELAPGDVLKLEGDPVNFAIGGWGGFGAGHWRGHMIVGRGTHTIPEGQWTGTWVGP